MLSQILKSKVQEGRDLLKRILHMAGNLQPFRFKHVMASASLRNHTKQAVLVRVCNPHGIVPAAADAPRNEPSLLDPWLLLYLVQNGAPQAFCTDWVIGIRRAVTRTGDLDND